jgi:8-oxo-dGTP diphosphatase
MEPVFGTRRADLVYVERPGAYGLALDEHDRIAIVQLADNRYFLPGGGIEQDETPETCLLREFAEEIAWSARIGTLLGRATQFVESVRGPLEVRAHYFSVTPMAPIAGPAEHDCFWLPPMEAIPLMAREADRWAIGHLLAADSRER